MLTSVLTIYIIGYFVALWWCKSQGKTWVESIMISFASVLLLVLYAIHFVYNYYRNKKGEE